MGILRNLGQRSGARRRPWERRLLLGVVGVVIIAVVAVVGAYYFDLATESDAFCGSICHANRPEYVTHEVSAHAGVECGTCHIGPGLLPKVMAKVYGVGELVSQVTNTFERPIEPPVERLPSVELMCEQCHWARMPHEGETAEISHFASDEMNSQTRTFLVMWLGSGDAPVGRGGGAHGHPVSVRYATLDPLKQEIPWVIVERDGQLVEYRSSDSSLTAEELAQLPRQSMTCLDCHNRATHVFRNPERSLDEALAEGRIARDLPFMKREGLRLLTASYSTQDAGLEAMEGLVEFYRTEYPDVYTSRQVGVEQAVRELQDIYRHATFPEMNLTWETYPDNLGHADFPGCFRCHDAEHLNTQGDAIPLNCGLCHSIPIVAGPGQEPDLSPLVEFVAQVEMAPDSHLETSFVRDHGAQMNDSCTSCHGPIQFGDDNSSFCANQACHGQTWPGADLDAAFTHPVELVGQHAEALCSECHQAIEVPALEDCAECHSPATEPHFGVACNQCHTPEGWGEAATAWLTDVPSVPHPIDDETDCLACHSAGASSPVPASHQSVVAESCLLCHQAGTIVPATQIPHSLEDREDCVLCHNAGGLPIPADHEGRNSESCLFCHEVEEGD